MRMSDIKVGCCYANRSNHVRRVLAIGTPYRPEGYRQPYSGVEWCYEGDENRKYRSLLSEFASNSTHLVVR